MPNIPRTALYIILLASVVIGFIALSRNASANELYIRIPFIILGTLGITYAFFKNNNKKDKK